MEIVSDDAVQDRIDELNGRIADPIDKMGDQLELLKHKHRQGDMDPSDHVCDIQANAENVYANLQKVRMLENLLGGGGDTG